jgi:hypothetical protein
MPSGRQQVADDGYPVNPAERAAAKKFDQRMEWIRMLQNGKKEEVRAAVNKVPAAERAEFEKLCKIYRVQL